MMRGRGQHRPAQAKGAGTCSVSPHLTLREIQPSLQSRRYARRLLCRLLSKPVSCSGILFSLSADFSLSSFSVTLTLLLPMQSPKTHRGRTLLARITTNAEQSLVWLERVAESVACSRKHGVPNSTSLPDTCASLFVLPRHKDPEWQSELLPIQERIRILPRRALLVDASLPSSLPSLAQGYQVYIRSNERISWRFWNEHGQRFETPAAHASHLLSAVLATSPPDTYLPLWAEGSRRWPEAALCWMEGRLCRPLGDRRNLPLPPLDPSALLPLLESENPAIRLRAISLVGRLAQHEISPNH